MIDDFNDESNLKVVYIVYVGKDVDNKNIYHFLLSEDCENTFAEGWAEKPACAEKREFMMPSDDMYEYIKELKTDMVLTLAQDSCEFTMQDARDHCVSLAYENLDNAEEYPEDGRIVIHFGDYIEDIERKLAIRDMRMKYI